MDTFSDFSLLPSLQKGLKDNRFSVPTEIQRRTLPPLLEGRSIIGISETGSGKTLAYALPILHKLKSMENAGHAVSKSRHPRAAIIVPTRELGEQVAKVFKTFTHTTRLRVRTLLGGTALEVAKTNISGSFEILVATPGRLVQLMNRHLISLVDVESLVFDEADQMLDPDFLPSAKQIAQQCSQPLQLSLFSATLSPTVQELIQSLFSEAELIRSEGSHKIVPTLTTFHYPVEDGRRFPILKEILNKTSKGGTLIFTNTRQQCDALAEALRETDHSYLIYRGEMNKVERRNNLKAFRNGEVNILISTDLASRGLDVEHVGRVINYHLPKEMDNYIHRVGRTARAGRKGSVYNLVTQRDQNLIAKLDSKT
jgi:superfamily II DNA/RNA helicase